MVNESFEGGGFPMMLHHIGVLLRFHAIFRSRQHYEETTSSSVEGQDTYTLQDFDKSPSIFHLLLCLRQGRELFW